MMHKRYKNIILKDNRGFLQKNSLKDINKKTGFKIVNLFIHIFQNQML